MVRIVDPVQVLSGRQPWLYGVGFVVSGPYAGSAPSVAEAWIWRSFGVLEGRCWIRPVVVLTALTQPWARRCWGWGEPGDPSGFLAWGLTLSSEVGNVTWWFVSWTLTSQCSFFLRFVGLCLTSVCCSTSLHSYVVAAAGAWDMRAPVGTPSLPPVRQECHEPGGRRAQRPRPAGRLGKSVCGELPSGGTACPSPFLLPEAWFNCLCPQLPMAGAF